MSAITTHVLDLALGEPAVGVPVRLQVISKAGIRQLARASTDSSGRAADLGPAVIEPGTYRLVFDTGAYALARRSDAGFFPEVTVTITISRSEPHCHIPLLLSPFGYATYRGS